MNIQPSSLAEFKRIASPGMTVPLIRQSDFFEDPFEIYRRFRDPGKPSVLLETARPSLKTGRYSYIASNPFLQLSAGNGMITLNCFGHEERLGGDPFHAVGKLLSGFKAQPAPDAPPFTGGAVGYFGYEAKQYVEPTLPKRLKEGSGLPETYFLFFDEGLALDHLTRRAYFFVNIKAGRDLQCSYDAGLRRLSALERSVINAWESGARAPRRDRMSALRPDRRRFAVSEDLGEETPSSGRAGIGSSLTRAEFVRKAGQIKRWIRSGDIFQANLSQRFDFPLTKDALEVYRDLKAINPSPFFGFLDAVDFQIVSGSPERLIKLENGRLETRPIAGTRWRGKDETEDLALSAELFLNPKERAEHIMLVDLERNDIGRVSEYGSVTVDELMTLENYSHVKHIVSNICGALKPGLEAIDALKAFFPGGTITGAPKVRCMEILDELEPVERGPYTGSLGYLGFSGNMDFNILIRSLFVKDGTGYVHAGAGIVADSIPQKEYEETLYKAEGIFAAIFGPGQARSILEERGLAARVS